MEDSLTTSTPLQQHQQGEEISDLSAPQEITLIVLQVCAAVLSLIGSSTIVFKIVRNSNRKSSSSNHNHHHHKTTTTPYDRIILGLSSCDIASSITYAIGPFLLPSDSSQRIWAFGNEATCQSLGFLLQLSCVWAIWYNCILSFYYLLTVRFRVRRDVFSRRYELWLHLSGLLFFPLTAMTGYFAQWYGEQALTMTCWVRHGDHAELVSYIFGGVPTLVTFLSLVINNIVIYVFVRKRLISAPLQSKHFCASDDELEDELEDEQEDDREQDRDRGGAGNNNRNSNNSRNSTTNNNEILVETQDFTALASVQRQLRKEAATQGFLYVCSFLLTATPVFCLQVLDGSFAFEEDDQGSIYPLLVMNAILMPLQGFFNVFIYVRPTYSRFVTVHPDKSRWYVLKQSLFDPNIPKLASMNLRSSNTSGGGENHQRNNSGSNKNKNNNGSSNNKNSNNSHNSKHKEIRGSRFSMSLDNIDEEDPSSSSSSSSTSEEIA